MARGATANVIPVLVFFAALLLIFLLVIPHDVVQASPTVSNNQCETTIQLNTDVAHPLSEKRAEATRRRLTWACIALGPLLTVPSTTVAVADFCSDLVDVGEGKAVLKLDLTVRSESSALQASVCHSDHASGDELSSTLLSLCHGHSADSTGSADMVPSDCHMLISAARAKYDFISARLAHAAELITSPVYDPSIIGPGLEGSVSVDAMFGETWESVAPRLVEASSLRGTAGEHFIRAILAYRVRAFSGEMGTYDLHSIGGGKNVSVIKAASGGQTPTAMILLVGLAATLTAAAVAVGTERGPPRRQRSASLVCAVNVLKGVAMVGTLYTHSFEVFTPPGTGSEALLSFLGGQASSTSSLLPLPLTLLSNGSRGVHLMFFLTGFVNALPVVCGRRSLSSFSDALQFWQKRAARIVPLLFIISTIALLTLPGDSKINKDGDSLGADLLSPSTFSRAFFLFSFLFPLHPRYWDGRVPHSAQIWSLGVTVSFLALFPGLFRLCNNGKGDGQGKSGGGNDAGNRHVSMKALLSALALLGVVCFCVRLFVIFGGIDGLYCIQLATNLRLPYAMFLRDSISGVADEFWLGVVMAGVVSSGWQVRQSATFISIWVMAGILWILAGCFTWDYVNLHHLPLYMVAVMPIFFQLGNACLLFAALGASLDTNTLAAPLAWLGKSSYAVLLLHGFTLQAAFKVYRNTDTMPEYCLRGCVYFLALFALSHACTVLISGGSATTSIGSKTKGA